MVNAVLIYLWSSYLFDILCCRPYLLDLWSVMLLTYTRLDVVFLRLTLKLRLLTIALTSISLMTVTDIYLVLYCLVRNSSSILCCKNHSFGSIWSCILSVHMSSYFLLWWQVNRSQQWHISSSLTVFFNQRSAELEGSVSASQEFHRWPVEVEKERPKLVKNT